jgi:hypothetical protein
VVRTLPGDEKTAVSDSPVVRTLPEDQKTAVSDSPVVRTLPEDEKQLFLTLQWCGLYQKMKNSCF